MNNPRIEKVKVTVGHKGTLTLGDGREVTPVVLVNYTNPDWKQSDGDPAIWELCMLLDYYEREGLQDEDEEEGYRFYRSFQLRLWFEYETREHGWVYRKTLLEIDGGEEDFPERGVVSILLWSRDVRPTIQPGKKTWLLCEQPIAHKLGDVVVVPVGYFGNTAAADRLTYRRVTEPLEMVGS